MARHTLVHLLHDAGAAAWFGGSLMGATSLNAAAAQLSDPSERTRVSTAGWSRWAPVNGAAVIAHLAGAAALTRTDAPRVALQQGMGRSTAIKTGVTAAGMGVAAWSALLNRKMAAAGAVPAQGATEPSSATPAAVASVQRQLKIVQWLNPLVSGAIIVTGAWHEEQQRTAQVVPGVIKGVLGRITGAVPGGAPVALPVAGLAAAALLKRRGKSSTSQSIREPQPITAYPTSTYSDTPTTTSTTRVSPSADGPTLR